MFERQTTPVMEPGPRPTDESIVAFASVRGNAATSDPSFGDFQPKDAQEELGVSYAEDVVPALIEVTQGSPNKYEIDKETGQLMLDRVLHSAVYYPGDYGYVPQTLCGDGDPLDILIVRPEEGGVRQGLDTGVVTLCRIVGLMDMEDESGHDEKILAVLETGAHRRYDHITELTHLPQHLRKEVQHFFENYKRLEKKAGKQKWAKVLGWGSKARAIEVLQQSRQAYKAACKDEAVTYLSRCRTPYPPNLLHVPQPQLAEPRADTLTVTCLVNVSKGNLNSYVHRQDTTYRHYKYTLDMPYPGNYGIICQTWKRGGGIQSHKPVEVLIISTFPLIPECLVEVRVIGAMERTLRMQQKDGTLGESVTDYKVVGVVAANPRTAHLQSLSDLSSHTTAHFEDFFNHQGLASGCQDVKILRHLQANGAADLIRESHQAYLGAHTDRQVHNAANLWCLPWTPPKNGKMTFPAVVESPSRSYMSYRFDRRFGALRHKKALATAAHWPGNFGFIPQTVAERQGPVEVMVLSTVPLEPLCVVEIRVVGAARCAAETGPDTKIIGVPKSEPRMQEWDSIEAVPSHMKDEIVHFLNAHKDLEESWTFCNFERWMSGAEAEEYLQVAHERFFIFTLPMQKMESRLELLEDENRALRQELLMKNAS